MASSQLQCIVVTPERALLDVSADFVALPLYDGEMGFLPGRAPLVGRLGFGELRIRQGNQVSHYYVDGGFVQVRGNTVTVLTSRAFKASEINPEAAEQALNKARQATRKLSSLQVQEANIQAQQKAMLQLRIARKSSSESA
jgi:F-type H+-transporting ATPase subunit epsilon